MAAKRELRAEVIAERPDRLAVPSHRAPLGTCEAAEDAQQARLAAAVGPLHLQAFARRNLERQRGEKPPRSAQAFEVGGIEHRQK